MKLNTIVQETHIIWRGHTDYKVCLGLGEPISYNMGRFENKLISKHKNSDQLPSFKTFPLSAPCDWRIIIQNWICSKISMSFKLLAAYYQTASSILYL